MTDPKLIIASWGVVRPGDTVYDSGSADCGARIVESQASWPFGRYVKRYPWVKPATLYKSRDDAFRARVKQLADEMSKATSAYEKAKRRYEQFQKTGE